MFIIEWLVDLIPVGDQVPPPPPETTVIPATPGNNNGLFHIPEQLRPNHGQRLGHSHVGIVRYRYVANRRTDIRSVT